MKLKHVVVATDLSEGARAAYSRAARLACGSGAWVTLLHVDETGPFGYRTTAQMGRFLDRISHARAALLTELRSMMRRYEVNADMALVSGEPAEQILECVDRSQADLLIMTRRSLHSLRRLVMGRTSNRVVRRIHIPTIVLPAGTDLECAGREEGCRIVLATDLSTNSRRGVRAALDFAELANGQVECVHVLQLPVIAPLAGEGPVMLPPVNPRELRRTLQRELDATLGSGHPRWSSTSVTLGHDVAHALNDVVRATSADMLCVPCSGKGRLAASLLGSTTQAVLKRAEVPVLLFPASYLEQNYAAAVPAKRPRAEVHAPPPPL